MAHWFGGDILLQYWLMGVASLPVLALFVISLYLGFTKPEMLQSEEWQIKQSALGVILQIGVILQKGKQISINPTTIEMRKSVISPSRRAGSR